MANSRNALNGKIKTLRRGLAIYRVGTNPMWRARVWMRSEGKYAVRSTKETDRLDAAEVAEEIAAKLHGRELAPSVLKSRTFETYAEKLVKAQEQKAKKGEISELLPKTDKSLLYNKDWGLVTYFAKSDITKIRTKEFLTYLEWLREKKASPMAASTENHIVSCFRKVLRIAINEGV